MSTRPTDPHRKDAAEGVLGGRYELLEAIGHGGMSTVYRARDRALGRPVAVKVIRHDPAVHGDPEHLRERFRREAANAARIPPHPNVVQVYDYGTDAATDQDFLVMELLGGQDLKAALRERRFGPSEAVHILLEAARGLAAGHRAGIVHRDVKPANLLLSEEGAEARVRVLDFGIAKALEGDPDEELTRVGGGVPHTPAYASPEQRNGSSPPGPTSDVYQLGLIACELLTGERPFDADDRARIARGEALPLPDDGVRDRIPPPLRPVLERALQPQPTDRYADAAAFAEALAAAWEGDQTLVVTPSADDATLVAGTGPEPPDPRPAQAAPGHRPGFPRWAGIALAAMVAALLLWALLRGRGGGSPAEEPVSTAELEEEFAPLYHEAAEWLAEQDAAEEP